MDKRVLPQQRRIILFGLPSLQNSVLVGYLQQQVGISTSLETQLIWRAGWNTTVWDTLVLIDSEFSRSALLIDLMDTIYADAPDVKVAFLGVQASHPTEKLIAWPMVAGLFYGAVSQQQLCKGVMALFAGEYWLPRNVVASYLKHNRTKPKKVCDLPLINLTKRERQILQLTSTGATNTEIACQLSVSMHTVKTHIYNLFKKIGVSNRIQAVNWAKDYLDVHAETPIET